MKKCKICGEYNDPSEWPEDVRDDYDPDMCYVCFRKKDVTEADEDEESEVETDDDPDGLAAQEIADQSIDEEEVADDEEK
jgi:hypothetical protein